MADRNKPGYMNFADIADRLESGKLNAYDTVYTKDTHEVVFIKEDKSLIRMKCRLDVYESVVVAEYYLNLNTDTYVGQIVGIQNGDWVRLYNVNYADDKFIVKKVGVDEYGQLENKPQINGVTLDGNKTTAQLGIDIPTKFSQLYDDVGYETINHLVENYYSKTEADNLFATQGSVPDELSDLDDITLSNVQNGQILKYNSATQKFENADESGGTINDAYKKFKVANTEIVASGEDTIELVAGANVTLTPDAVNKKITISSSGGGGGSTGDMLKEVYDTNNDGIVNAADEATTLTGLNTTVSELNALDGITSNVQEQLNSKADSSDIPTELSDLTDDENHRLVTDAEKTEWSGKADTSDIPTALSQLENDDNYVQDANYVHTDNNFTNEDKAAIGNIPENITDLSDVAVDNIQNGQILKWDVTQEKFVNADESGGGSGDVADVKVNGTSVVDPITKEANIDLSGYAETSDIPTDLADLSDDATHRLVTDTEKSTWDNKADVSDIPTVNNNTITIQKNGQNIDSFTLNQNSNKAINISVPTKTSDLQNDSSFITNTVNNLANYYLKSDTYTQTEVNNLISAAVNGRFEKVTTLPASGEPNVIYLVPKTTALTNNVYDEYIWQDNAWELLGSTEIDLSNYVTTTDLSTALADYVTSSTFNTTIANYYTKTEVGNLLDNKVDKVSGKGLSTYDYDATAKGIVDNVTTNLAGKVDKVNGKGLSTNDYDNTAKGIVDGVTNALAGKVDKVNGKGLSTEDYTTNEKNKLSGISTGANKTEASTTNGNIKIDSVETPVYRNYGNNTVLTTDKTPFLTRQTLNPTGFSGYVREKLIGASYAWNQLVDKTKLGASTSFRGITMTNNGDGTLSFTGTGDGTGQPNFTVSTDISVSMIANHVYLLIGCPQNGSNLTYFLLDSDNQKFDYGDGVLIKSNGAHTINSSLRIRFGNTYAISGTLKFRPQLIDLTLAFGSTIADYLYNLSNNGGITKLRDMGCPIDEYTAYGNYLVSSKTSGKLIRGFNQWDEQWEVGGINVATGVNESDTRIRSKNPIPVLPNTAYYVKDVAWVLEYDANENYLGIYVGGNTVFTTSANTHYLKFKSGSGVTTYSNNFCVNISDTNKNGQYEPYSSITHSLGNDELRGVFQLVNNEIVAYGDTKESNGKIGRNFGIVDLGSLTWTYSAGGRGEFSAVLVGGKRSDSYTSNPNAKCSKYYTRTAGYTSLIDKSLGFADKSYSNECAITVNDSDYSNAATFKTAMSGVYLIYELATPTTEQSTPFADPMSLVGATTEEYIDDRTIPCPVGAERQYMGQSEDIVEIPSSPQSDGKRKLVAETSGGKTQYYFENDSDKPKRTMLVNLESYSSHSNKYEAPCDGYAMIMVYAGTGLVVMEVSDCNGVTLAMQSMSNPPTTSYISSFMKKGMKFHYTNNDGLSLSPTFRGIT